MNTQRELPRRGGTGEGNLSLRTRISMRPAKHSVVIKLATVETVTAIFASVRAGAKPVVQPGRPGGKPGGGGKACRPWNRDMVSALSYEAVYRHEVDQLVDLARYLEAETAPVEALRRWLQAGVEFMVTKRGIAAALAMAAQGSPDLVAYSLDRLTRAVVGTVAARCRAGRDSGRHRCRGPASNSGRHVLRPRPAGLASQGPAPGRCLRRWTTPPARQHDDLHLRQSIVAPTAAPARQTRGDRKRYTRKQISVSLRASRKGHSWSIPT